MAAKQAERDKLQQEVKDLATQRQQFMEAEAKKAKSQTLEGAIMDSVREQAGKRGIEYAPGGPALYPHRCRLSCFLSGRTAL